MRVWMGRCFSVGMIVLTFALSALALPTAMEMASARHARDIGDYAGLRAQTALALAEAQKANTAEAWLWVAQLDNFACEAADVLHNDKDIIAAARDGVAAAQKAVALDPRSSDAHALLGNLQGQLIPHVFGGVIRYGVSAPQELDQAIKLDPSNVRACIWRGIGYMVAPSVFGGDKAKALALLQKAVSLDPNSDTAHLWLAQFYEQQGRHADALREIALARRLDPDRLLTLAVYDAIAGKPGAAALRLGN